MGKIRRGGFIFITWIGDHSPYHVHVYRDGELVVKWDLEHEFPMKGEALRKCSGSSVSCVRRDGYEDL